MIAGRSYLLTLLRVACTSERPLAENQWPTCIPATRATREVDVTSGQVLKGRTRAYMLLYVTHDNEA
jgi:hypothetical protein